MQIVNVGFAFKPSCQVWLCCYLHWHNKALVLCIAGVADVEEAQAGLDFAKRFEIIKGAEAKNIRLEAVDLSDESAIADALPRYSFAAHLQMHSLCVFLHAKREVNLSCMSVTICIHVANIHLSFTTSLGVNHISQGSSTLRSAMCLACASHQS